MDLDLLRSFTTVVDTQSFTRAAERLRLNQSSVSLQVQRLETQLGRRLLERGRGSVRLTPEGELLLGYAREVLRLTDEARARLAEPDLEGVVRLGTPEDFATTHLPEVLARFAHSHPRVALEVTCDLTLNLLDRFAQGSFDLVLVKRVPQGPSRGVRVWREPLVWAGRADAIDGPDATVKLVVSPHPCVYRRRALEVLEGAGRRPRIVYSSTSLSGTQAAITAGLGITVLPREMVPPGVPVLEAGSALPPLEDTEIALLTAQGALPRAGERLAAHIVRSLDRGAGGA